MQKIMEDGKSLIYNGSSFHHHGCRGTRHGDELYETAKYYVKMWDNIRDGSIV
jgi:hypothetical protein